jgi:hypothetical protein
MAASSSINYDTAPKIDIAGKCAIKIEGDG